MTSARALYAFEGQQPTDISFNEGDTIECVFQTDSSEWYARILSRHLAHPHQPQLTQHYRLIGTVGGLTGIFPSTHVDVKDDYPGFVPIRALAVYKFDGLSDSRVPPDVRAAAEASGLVLLSFDVGQSLFCVRTTYFPGWGTAVVNGVHGYFPLDFVSYLAPVYPPEYEEDEECTREWVANFPLASGNALKRLSGSFTLGDVPRTLSDGSLDGSTDDADLSSNTADQDRMNSSDGAVRRLPPVPGSKTGSPGSAASRTGKKKKQKRPPRLPSRQKSKVYTDVVNDA